MEELSILSVSFLSTNKKNIFTPFLFLFKDTAFFLFINDRYENKRTASRLW